MPLTTDELFDEPSFLDKTKSFVGLGPREADEPSLGISTAEFLDEGPSRASIAFDAAKKFMGDSAAKSLDLWKKVGGNAGVIADFVLGMPAFVGGFAANVGTTAGTALAGAPREEAWQAGRKAAELPAVSDWFKSPVHKLLSELHSEKTYEESITAEGLEKLMGKIKSGGKWLEKASDGSIPAESFETQVDSLLLGLGPLAARAGRGLKKLRQAKQESAKADVTASIEPEPPQPSTALIPAELTRAAERRYIPTESELIQGPPSIPAGKPRIKLKVKGEVDIEALGWLTALSGSALAAQMIYAEVQKSGRSVWDILREPRGAPQEMPEGEPEPTDTGSYLADGGAALLPFALGAVKGKGGMWHPEAVKRLSGALTPDRDYRAGMLTPAEATKTPSGAWADRAVTNYLNKHAGTATDPLKDIEIPFGERVKRWEEVTDRALYGKQEQGPRGAETQWNVATQLTMGWKEGVALNSYLSHVGDYLRNHVPVEKLQNYDLVRAVKETAAWDAAMKKKMEMETKGLYTKLFKDATVYKDYGDGFRWVQLDKPGQFAYNATQMGNSVRGYEPPKNLYGGGAHTQPGVIQKSDFKHLDWIPESEYGLPAGQSSSGHPGYGLGGWEAIKRGDAKVYALIDSKGKSHVTVEVQPKFDPEVLLDPGQMMRPNDQPHLESIIQIKGKQNRAPVAEYLPYVQDFVKGGKWGEVGDLQNTGLIDIQALLQDGGPYARDPKFVATLKENFGESRYVDSTKADKLWRDYANARAGLRGERGSAAPRLLKSLGATAGGAMLGSLLADPEDKIAGSVIGGLAALGLSTGAGKALARKSQVYREVERSVTSTIDRFVRKLNPDLLGPQAEKAASVLGSAYVGMMRSQLEQGLKGETRREFWNKRPTEEQVGFLKGLELGKVKWKNKDLETLSTYYKDWMKSLYEADKAKGIEYQPVDNYVYHLFENPDAVVQFFEKKYGTRWGDPSFTKERQARFIGDAEKAGFKLKYTNPEQVMLARQHASDVAHMKVDALDQLVEFNLARKVTKGDKAGPGETLWRSPNGKLYFLLDEANQIFHNAFNTRSLWDDPGLSGMTYRGAMWIKNAVVPWKLWSLFHPIHVELGMNFGTTGVNAMKMLAAGKIGAGEAFVTGAKSALLLDVPKRLMMLAKSMQPRAMKAFRGEIPEKGWSPTDRSQITNAIEGSFNPEMAVEYRNQHIKAFRDAIKRHSATAAWHLPFAGLEYIWTRPVFENWIPGMKWEAYQKSAAAHLAANPELASSQIGRMVALRRIAKVVDDRFGEMQYKTLFMDRMVKDIAVASFLSYGWQLGFMRSYLGAVPEAWSAFTKSEGGFLYKPSQKGGTLKQRIARGDLDKTLFLGNYLAGTMLYAGLLTWALTGEGPKDILDYIYPRTGEKNPDGSDARVSTPFYTREFVSIPKHIKEEGLVGGLGVTAANKLSPAVGMLKAIITNKDFFNKEISDPNAPIATRMGQRLAYTLGEMEPIATGAPKRMAAPTAKDYALAGLGFTPAPKYVTESPAEAQIRQLLKYHRPAATSYERAKRSEDITQLYQMQQAGRFDKFEDKLLEVMDKYKLSSGDITRLRRESAIPGKYRMFRMLNLEEQRRVLGKMEPAEREAFLPYAKKALRRELD